MNPKTTKTNILNAGRFWKLTVYDTQKAVTSILPTIATIAALWMLGRIMLYIINSHTNPLVSSAPFNRGETILLLTTIVTIITPSKLYRRCNTVNSGIPFAMLPASKAEKYLSMLLQCTIIIPLSAFAIYFLTDFITTVITETYIPPHFSAPSIHIEKNKICMRLGTLLSPLLTTSYFIMATTYFKHHKLIYSLIVPTLFIIILSFIVIRWAWLHLEDIATWESIELPYESFGNILIAIKAVAVVAFLIIGWHHLKRSRY